jgi:CRISPR/Cas system endoribonuclease Cas6 (RAMP superfamily)
MDTTVLQNSQALLATVLSFGGASGIVVVKKIYNYLTTKTTIIQDSEARDVANSALSTLDTLLETNITYAENVLKKPIIESIQDGKVTKDELKSLANIVKTNVLSQLTDSSKTSLSQIATNVEDFVEKRLETVLGNLKVSDASSVKATEIALPTTEQLDNASLKTQLAQEQADKESISQQLVQLQNNKVNVEQANAQLNNQINQVNAQNQTLAQQVSDLTNKLNTITSTLSSVVQPQPVQTPVDNIAQVQDNTNTTANVVTQ